MTHTCPSCKNSVKTDSQENTIRCPYCFHEWDIFPESENDDIPFDPSNPQAKAREAIEKRMIDMGYEQITVRDFGPLVYVTGLEWVSTDDDGNKNYTAWTFEIPESGVPRLL